MKPLSLVIVGAVVVGRAAASPDVERAAIQALLDAMAQAVLAGDQEAYLARVDQDDPVFAAEQRAWARDLGLHVPATFALTLGELSVEGESPTSARASLTMDWRLPADDQGEHPARSVTFDAVFARGGERGSGGWRYAGEAWEVAEGQGVRVFYAEGLGDVAQGVVEAFPEVRAHVEEGFERTVDRVQEIKLYGEMELLQASIYLSYEDGLSGWNEPGESIKLVGTHLGRGGGRGGTSMLLAHEFGHVCTFELGPKSSGMPWWTLEGIAELSAEKFAGGGRGVDRRLRRAASRGELIDWSALADFRTCKPEHMGAVYAQGHSMLAFISEQHDRTKRNAWLAAMANGASVEEATIRVLGISFAELDARWRAHFVSPENAEESVETRSPN